MREEEERKIYYRYMSRKEAEAVEKTGMLRGGRGAGVGETYWTEEVYGSATEWSTFDAVEVEVIGYEDVE